MRTITSEELVVTSFSDFIRHASKQEKEKVFSRIVASANHEQQEMLAKAKKIKEQATNLS